MLEGSPGGVHSDGEGRVRFPGGYLDGLVVLGGGRGPHQDEVGLPEHQLHSCLGGGVGDRRARLIDDVLCKVVQQLLAEW